MLISTHTSSKETDEWAEVELVDIKAVEDIKIDSEPIVDLARKPLAGDVSFIQKLLGNKRMMAVAAIIAGLILLIFFMAIGVVGEPAQKLISNTTGIDLTNSRFAVNRRSPASGDDTETNDEEDSLVADGSTEDTGGNGSNINRPSPSRTGEPRTGPGGTNETPSNPGFSDDPSGGIDTSRDTPPSQIGPTVFSTDIPPSTWVEQYHQAMISRNYTQAQAHLPQESRIALSESQLALQMSRDPLVSAQAETTVETDTSVTVRSDQLSQKGARATYIWQFELQGSQWLLVSKTVQGM